MNYLLISLLVLNAILGLLLLEWAWKQLRNVIETQDEERNKQYPAFYRRDVKDWSKNKFRLGAATFLLVRLVFYVGSALTCAILLYIINFFNKEG
jgi:hypothetical protein